MKMIATIEARMTSSRLPGKVLMSAAGKTMLEHLVHRLKRVPFIQQIVLATTINTTDQPLVEFAQRAGIGCFRGSEDDVMMRVLGAAESVNADVIVEITGDCPIIDPRIVEQTIRMFQNNTCDYCSNVGIRCYPDGMDTQVFYIEALRKSAGMTQDPQDHEHVSLHMRQHPDIFRAVTLVAPPDLFWPELRLTLDTEQDFNFIKMLIETLGPADPCFGCADVIRYLRTNPGLVAAGQESRTTLW